MNNPSIKRLVEIADQYIKDEATLKDLSLENIKIYQEIITGFIDQVFVNQSESEWRKNERHIESREKR